MTIHSDLEKKGIFNSFDNCMVIFYEGLFIIVWIQLPFSKFKVVVLKSLKIAHSRLHLGLWTYIRAFQLCVAYKSLEPSINLFFFLSFSPEAYVYE